MEEIENSLDFVHIINFRSISRAIFQAEIEKKKILDSKAINKSNAAKIGW